jgi:crotonobetainyl-CoA:carnitine CoA-transferase CaiB-like acyl-CoA transferase
MDSVAKLLATEDNSFWLDRLQKNGIPSAPVNTFADALSDPHVIDRDMVVNVTHPSGKTMRQVGNPIKLSEHESQEFTSPPLLGQHTDEVLRGILGFTREALTKFKEAGAIQ